LRVHHGVLLFIGGTLNLRTLNPFSKKLNQFYRKEFTLSAKERNKKIERIMVSTTTSKGQITLPKAIRNKLNLKAGDKIEFATDEAGAVRIIPLKSSVRELKNMVPKPAPPFTAGTSE
jgi:antitoxin PrlF